MNEWSELEQKAQALKDLNLVVRSQQDKLTLQETDLIRTCQDKCLRAFVNGALVGGVVTFAATWRLGTTVRPWCPPIAACVLGLWNCGKSVDAFVDQVLDLNGSMIQRELANVICDKHQNNPFIMDRMRRHFYLEKVFDDSSSDKPIVRWQYRNFIENDVAYGQRTNGSDCPSDLHVSHSKTDHKNVSTEAKQVPMNADVDVTEDPLDGIFGQMAQAEEINHPSSSSTPARANTRSHRRYHRRRRLHHHESSSTKHKLPQSLSTQGAQQHSVQT